MANISTRYSDALPTTRPGISPSIGAERDRALSIPDTSVRKWGPQGAGAISGVSKDWGRKIIQARDVYELNKAKIVAQESYRNLMTQMNSPEFRAKNDWQSYNGYYSDKSKGIQADVNAQFKGTPISRNKSLSLMLRDMHGQHETKVSGAARLGEIGDMQRSIPESLEYYGRDAAAAARAINPKTGKHGDPKAIIDAMSNAEAYLDSMKQAGVISGPQQEAYRESFQASVNNVIHKERIYDAIAIKDRATAISNLKGLVKDYSEPREDLDEDQRVTYKHMAQQALSTRLRQEGQKDLFSIYQLEEKRKNSLAFAKEKGEGGLLSVGEFVDTYGNKSNKAKAEYTEYKSDYLYSMRHHDVMSQVDALPPFAYSGALSDYKSKIENIQADDKNPFVVSSHDQLSILNDAEQRANQNIQMLLDDPGKFAKERAAIPKDLTDQDFFDATIQEQLKRGVGDKEAAILPNDDAKRAVGVLIGQSADDSIDAITSMKKQYGKHFSTVMRDMQRQKLPVAYELVARMDPGPTGDRALMEDILKANSLNDQEWSKTMGIDAQLMRQQVNDQINNQFKPYEDALMNSAVTPDDIKKVGDLKTLMGNLALYRMESGSLGLSDISNATSSSVRDVMEQYNSVPNQRSRFNIGDIGFGGQDPYNQRFLIPKAWSDRIGSDKAVYDVLKDSRSKLIDEELDSTITAMVAKNKARGFEEYTKEDISGAKEAFIREAYWATDNSDDGLLLMNDNGLRLRVTYDKILEWSKEVPK